MVHATRRRTGSFIRRPRHLDDSPERSTTTYPVVVVSAAAAASVTQHAAAATTAIVNTSESSTPTTTTATTSQPDYKVSTYKASPTNPHGTRGRRGSSYTAQLHANIPTATATAKTTSPAPAPVVPEVHRVDPVVVAVEQVSAPSRAEGNVDRPSSSAPADFATTTAVVEPRPPPFYPTTANTRGPMPSFPFSDAYSPLPVDDKRHPRDLVPLEIGFPTDEMQHVVRKEDADDRLLMAACAVLHSHQNRALCPKEIAEVMFERGWLHNAGTTPFAHISTCIRAHLRRATTAVPPYLPILTSFELVGSLPPSDVAAVGLRAEERPAVKRGTLWYLDERVFGPGVGADDPFVRCRRTGPIEATTMMTTTTTPVFTSSTPSLTSVQPMATDEADDEDGSMGRGKRKRRASHAAIAAASADFAVHSPVIATTSAPHPAPIQMAPVRSSSRESQSLWGHRRSQSLGGVVHHATSAPARTGVPRLRLKLAALEEHDSGMDDSDGFTSDAARRRSRNKKKIRHSASAGNSRAGSADFDEEEGVDVDLATMQEDLSAAPATDQLRPGAYSSATSSALLAQSLRAASSSSPSSGTMPLNEATSLKPPHAEVISPDSLALDPQGRPRLQPHHLSVSAPNLSLFSSFRSARSPDIMEVETGVDERLSTTAAEFGLSAEPTARHLDSDDEHDFHEAMLRGDDFDFEWGSESHVAAPPGDDSDADADVARGLLSDDNPGKGPGGGDDADELHKSLSSLKAPSREMSVGVPESFDLDIKDDVDVDVDALSTPATTPRSPLDDPDLLACSTGGLGMEATLCEALEDQAAEQTDASTSAGDRRVVEPATVDRATSTDSLTSLVDEDLTSPQQLVPPSSPLVADGSAVPAPLPSPLALDMPHRLSFNAGLPNEYDFVGRDEEDDGAMYHSQYVRDMAEAADDEDEDGEEDLGRDEDDEDYSIDVDRIKVEDSDSFDLPFSTVPRPSRPFGEPYSRRFARETSTSSSGSESDVFDSGAILSKSRAGSGLPSSAASAVYSLGTGALHSPPDITDWSLNFDLDELDTELGGGADLLGPEMVALEELDLAWADEQCDGETDDEWRVRQAEHAATKATSAAAAAFLTGAHFDSPSFADEHGFNIPSAKSRAASGPSSSRMSTPVVAAPGLKRSPSSQSSISRRSAARSVVIQPKVPLSIPVTAAVLDNGFPVYVAEVTLHDTATTAALLRRVDTDRVNATTLLRVTFADEEERAARLSEISDRIEITNGAEGVPGIWVPLRAARELAAEYTIALGHLGAFLEDDLGDAFSPIVATDSKAKTSPSTAVSKSVGCPLFEGQASYFDDGVST